MQGKLQGKGRKGQGWDCEFFRGVLCISFLIDTEKTGSYNFALWIKVKIRRRSNEYFGLVKI